MTLFGRFLALLGLGLVLLPGAMPGAVRLAVLGDGETATLADLLSVELSKTEGIVLVERAELARVAGEQALTATGRTGGENALRLGRLLRADGVALLVPGPKGGSDGGTLRLLAVGPGVGVADVPLPAAGVDPLVWSRLAAGRLIRVLPKLGVRAGEAVPVSLLGLRAAVRPAFQVEPLERELSLALAARLRGAPEVFVLERQRLDALGAERELAPAAEDETPFWTGGFLLDGTIDRDNLDPARLTLDVRLRARDASAPPISLHVEGPRDAGPVLVEELAGKILAAIGRSAPAPAGWDALAEAAEFEVEGHWAARWNQWPEAEAALQSAWALGNRRRVLAVALIEVLTHQADPRRKADAATTPPFAFARHALTLYREHTGIWGLPSYQADPDWYVLGCRSLEAISELLRIAGLHPTFLREHRAELAEVRREVREVAAMLRSANLDEDSPAPARNLAEPSPAVDDQPPNRGQKTATTVDMLQAFYAPVWNDGPEGAIAVYRSLFTGGRCARPADASRVRRGLSLREFELGALPIRGDEMPDWQGIGAAALRARWEEFTAELIAVGEPSARFYGRLLALRRAEGGPEWVGVAERLLNDLWQAHPQILSDVVEFDCLYLTLKNFQTIGGVGPGPGRAFVNGPLKQFRFNVLSVFLNFPAANDQVAEENFFVLLPSRSEVINHFYSMPEAERLRGLADRFRGKVSAAKVHTHLWELPWPEPAATPAPLLAATPRPTPPAPTPDPRCLRVTRRFVPLPGGHVVGLRADDSGRIWADVRGARAANGSPADALVAVDPATGRTEVIPQTSAPHFSEFPASRGSFEIVGDTPFTSRREGILRYDRKSARWEKLPLPASYAKLCRADGRLLISTADAILRYDPVTGQSEVLASARRRPALSALDSAGELTFPTLHLVSGGGVQAVVRGRTFLLDPTTKQWRDQGLRSIPTGGMTTYFRAGGGDAYTLLTMPEDENRLPWVLGPPERLPDWRTAARITSDPPANRFHAALRFEVPWTEVGGNHHLRSRPGDLWLWFEGVDPAGRDNPNDRFPPFSLGNSRAQLVTTDAGLAIADEGRSDFWFIPNSELEVHAVR